MLDDAYAYWSAKLAGEDPDPPADRTLMPSGFWRLRDSSPLATWREDGDPPRFYALRGFTGKTRAMSPAAIEQMAESGSFGHAVTEADYRQALEAGFWEKDEPPPIERPRPGSNMPTDPYQAIKAELESELENSAEILARPISDQATADKAATWSRRVGQLLTRAEAERELEKRPHLEAGRAVDAKWTPIRDDARSLVDRLKFHVGLWLKRQKREADEKRRQAEEEARFLREQAEAERSPVEAAELVAEATAIEKSAEPERIIAGRPNMRVGLRTVRVAKIVDYEACLAALKDHKEIRELVERLANRAVRAGVPLAGVDVVEEDRAA